MSEDWRPSCSLELLRRRAEMLQTIRQFFAERDVLEVETPLLSLTVGTDPQLDFFTTSYAMPPQQTLYLQTSPEFAMKRLLAAGSGSIYQICKAFRNGEAGRFHNPEFTILEWYRVGFELAELMQDITDLILAVFKDRHLDAPQRFSYQTVFQQQTGLDPLQFDHDAYCAYAQAVGLPEAVALCGENHALWLDFIFSHQIQPQLGKNALCLVYGYPACQSSLARFNIENPSVTERVELFLNGIELGNGYYELADYIEQERRFDTEIMIRKQQNLPLINKDNRLIAALKAGLPNCSGIAIGLDRLLMLLTDSLSLSDVLAFPIDRA